MKVSAESSREAQATVLAFRLAGRDLKKKINDGTRAKFNAPWRSAVETRTTTPFERKVLARGARVAAGSPPSFVAASSKRALSGGLVPDSQWPAAEFGSNKHPQLPPRRPKGPVFKALDEMIPRAASLWSQIIVRIYSDAAEGR